MSLGSYVWRKCRSPITHLIVTPKDILPALRARHPLSLVSQTQDEIQTLLEWQGLSNITHQGRRYYHLSSKSEDTKQGQNASSTQCRLHPVARQPKTRHERPSRHVSKPLSQTPHFVSTLAHPDPAHSKDHKKHSGCVQRVNPLNRFIQRHREFKDHIRKDLIKERFPWSQDWHEPFELLKRYYKAEGEEQVECRPPAGGFKPPKISRQIPVDQIPEPLEWSIVTFEKYVKDLDTSTLNRLVQRQIYGFGKSHVTAVATIFEKLFQSADMKGFLSARACNTALAFFYKHGMVSKARALYTRMESLHMQIEPETFDLVLRGSAANKDLYSYTYHLQRMIERKVNLTPKTWSSLLMAVDSSDARAAIVQSMRDRKLLDRFSTMKDVVNLTIRDEVGTHIDRCNGMSTFFQDMDTRYSKGWLTISGASKILDEVGMRRSAQEAFELLKEIRQRVPTLNDVALNTLLTYCCESRAHQLAIDVVDYFEDKEGINPGQKVYEVLFRQAWRSRLYNFSRVIWRTACMDAAVTFPMQKLVMESLIFQTPDGPDCQPRSRADIWKTAAGKVIVGIGIAAKEGQPDEIQHPGMNSSAPVQYPRDGNQILPAHLEQLMDDTKVPRPKYERLRSAKALLDNDLAAFRNYRMQGKFVPLLREALAMDRDWTKHNWREKSTQFKCSNAIGVMEERTSAANNHIYPR